MECRAVFSRAVFSRAVLANDMLELSILATQDKM